ncbi:MAG: 30S ribosomal protein S9 [Patescibacteria group bacterium]
MSEKKELTNQVEVVKATRGRKEKHFYGVGRRKTSVASVFLYTKKGDFFVNGKTFNDYFDLEAHKNGWMKPFHIVGVSHPVTTFSGTVKVSGSGKSSQFDAVLLAISKALVAFDGENRNTLRKHDMLTRDPREVERKKPFLRKARKAPQYSKR